MTSAGLALLGVFGLMIGSFLNVCISRLPALPFLRDSDPLVRQRPRAELPAVRRTLPILPRADRLAIPGN